MFNFINYWQARDYKLKLENSYLRAINDLSGNVQVINTTLTKGMYAGTSDQIQELSSQIWSEAGDAKMNLSQLPMEYLNLNKTYKLLSQVGDYSKTLAEKVARGETITDQEQKNLARLRTYCENMNAQIASLQEDIQTGKITFDEVNTTLKKDYKKDPGLTNLSNSFMDVEDGITEYPTLIYDGPFSDSIMKKQPAMTKDAKTVSREKAREKAASVINVDKTAIKDGTDEEGKMPSYGFTKDGTSISVTKAGGFLCYMLNSRSVGEATLKTEDGIKKARNYLDKLDIGSMTQSYYEIANNILTVNFATIKDDVTIYTELVKISVALDNGEVVGFDARGYISNHIKRTIKAPKITPAKAKQSVSNLLTIEKTNLAIIPSQGTNDVYVYEFLCEGKDGEKVLVYVNANTGAEEQILILIINENGILTL
jgi:germination protein YpeB